MKPKQLDLNRELTEEQERLEKEIKECKCNNDIGIGQLVLGDCGLCDVRFAKHEGIRFAGEKFGEFIKELKKEIQDNGAKNIVKDIRGNCSAGYGIEYRILFRIINNLIGDI